MTILNGTSLGETIMGSELSDFIYGRGGNDFLYGNGGDDRLDGGSGADQLFGGVGNDIYYVDNVGDAVIENAGEGRDLVVSSISWTLGANVENLTLTGTAANGTGNSLNNVIRGDSSANILSGGDGNDDLAGRGGNDSLLGGAGNDRLYSGSGNDLLDGGAGFDTASYATAGSRVLVDLSVSTGQYTAGAGTDTLVSIEGLIGSPFDDSLIGNAGNNRISGGAGNDYLTGGGGADRLTGGSGGDYFYYDAFDNGDVLTDFVSGTDHIDLHLMWGSQFTFIGNAEFSGTPGEGRFENGLFQLDYNGDGQVDLSFTVPDQLVAADIIASSPWDY
jgi:Ca2+-binding RTX toxin-like protein